MNYQMALSISKIALNIKKHLLLGAWMWNVIVFPHHGVDLLKDMIYKKNDSFKIVSEI